MQIDRSFARLSELRTLFGVLAVLGATLLPSSTGFAADPIASTLPHPNSRGACRSRAAVASRFAEPAQARSSAASTDGFRVQTRGAQLLVSGAGLLALVSAPAASRGGGVIANISGLQSILFLYGN